MKKQIFNFKEFVVSEQHINESDKADDINVIHDFTIVDIGPEGPSDIDTDTIKSYTIKKLNSTISKLSPGHDIRFKGSMIVRLGRLMYKYKSNDIRPIIKMDDVTGDEFIAIYRDGKFSSVQVVNHTQDDVTIEQNIQSKNKTKFRLDGLSKDDVRRQIRRYNFTSIQKEFIVDLDSGEFKFYVEAESNKNIPKVALTKSIVKGMSFEAGREFSYYSFDKTQNKKIVKTGVVSDYDFDEDARILYILTDDKRRIKFVKDSNMIINPKKLLASDVSKIEELIGDETALTEDELRNVKFLGKVNDMAIRKGKVKSKYVSGNKYIPYVRIKATSLKF